MKKLKKEIKFAYQSDYYFPGPKYAEKLISKLEGMILDKPSTQKNLYML